MLGQQRAEGRRRLVILAVARRWFRARPELGEGTGEGVHGHWDRRSRTWRYHSHRRSGRSPGR